MSSPVHSVGGSDLKQTLLPECVGLVRRHGPWIVMYGGCRVVEVLCYALVCCRDGVTISGWRGSGNLRSCLVTLKEGKIIRWNECGSGLRYLVLIGLSRAGELRVRRECSPEGVPWCIVHPEHQDDCHKNEVHVPGRMRRLCFKIHRPG